MRPTVEDVRSWTGRDVVDAEGHELGRLMGAFLDAGDRPRWLAVQAGDGEVVPVPVEGVEPTGGAVRAAALGKTVRGAPRLALQDELTDELERRLEAHYGVGGDDATPSPQPAPDVEAGAQEAIVERLREAYALESEALLRLQTLVSVVEDDEVQHDATLHTAQTEMHRTGVQARLAALEASSSTLHDAAHAAKASLAGLVEKIHGNPVVAVRDAEAFERREAAFYAELEELARAAGDTATADLAAGHRADEEAMAVRFAGSIPRLDSPV